MNETNLKHFKTAQIAGMEVNLKDLEKINSYALSRLEPADIFAFKVSMASNEIDRDYEVFPRSTLVKLANLFVGKTVVKDHDHRSDNQIARIFSTELRETNLAHMTKTGEVYTELIAKCYMVKTSKNADLIAEIQAGIRKEVSLGCRVDKAVCSICGTDNVKTYCEHFPGKRYGSNQLCYFSLENASDAYELSFVAVPAQPYAGTVKSYGKKPCCEEEIMERKKALENSREGHRAGKSDVAMEKRLMVNHEEESGARLTVNREESAEVHKTAPISPENERNVSKDAPKSRELTPNEAESAPKDVPDTAPDEPAKEGSQAEKDDAVDTKEMLKQLHEIAQQFLVFQKSFMAQKEAEQETPSHEVESASDSAADKSQSKEPENKEERSDKDQPEDKKGGQEEGEAKSQESSQEKDGKSEPKTAEERDASPEAKVEGDGKGAQSEEDAKAQEEAANKDKTAQARLRALDLALSLRKKHQ